MTNFSQENQEIINDINKKLDKTDQAKLARVFETHNPDPLDSLLNVDVRELNNLIPDFELVDCEFTQEDQEEFDIVSKRFNQECSELVPIENNCNLNFKKLDIEKLSDILAVSTFISTQTHDGMLIHEINHPTIGKAITVQASNGALIFTVF